MTELYEFDIEKRDDDEYKGHHGGKDCKKKKGEWIAISGYILKVKYSSFEVLTHDG